LRNPKISKPTIGNIWAADGGLATEAELRIERNHLASFPEGSHRISSAPPFISSAWPSFVFAMVDSFSWPLVLPLMRSSMSSFNNEY